MDGGCTQADYSHDGLVEGVEKVDQRVALLAHHDQHNAQSCRTEHQLSEPTHARIERERENEKRTTTNPRRR
jgi:hypothetical protein